MFSPLFLFSLAALLPASLGLVTSDISDDIMEELNRWNLFARCYGEEYYLNLSVDIQNAFEACQGVAAPSPLTANEVGQKKADGGSGGLLQPTQEEIAAFGTAALNLKNSMPAKVGNISCVLTKINWLDGAGNVNLEGLTVEKWKKIGTNGAARNPAFVMKMQEGFTDCYNISQALPQSTLDKNPMSKVWGRQIFFFKCAKKMAMKTCAQAQMLEHWEKLNGRLDPATFPELNGDLYDSASYAFNVESQMMSMERKMIQRFIVMGSVH
jgi:hypothetical protein